jgi:hypothetical protein
MSDDIIHAEGERFAFPSSAGGVLSLGTLGLFVITCHILTKLVAGAAAKRLAKMRAVA